MAPACFFTYRAIKQGLPSRYPLELLVALLHSFGMVMFCAVEIYEGNLNVPAVDPIGNAQGRFANLKFTENHVTYWWFAFLVSESIWGIIPFLLGRRAFNYIVAMINRQSNLEKKSCWLGSLVSNEASIVTYTVQKMKNFIFKSCLFSCTRRFLFRLSDLT